MITVPPLVNLSGDKPTAAFYTGFGKKMLADLKADLSRMYDEPLVNGTRTKQVGGGVVTVSIQGNNSLIDIFMPTAEAEIEVPVETEEEDKYYLVFVMGNWPDPSSPVPAEPDDAKTIVWDINLNDYAVLVDVENVSDEVVYLDYPCDYRKIKKFVEDHEIEYDRGRGTPGQEFQGECYRVQVGYGRSPADMYGMHPPAETLPPGCSSELGYCTPESGGSPCLIGYHNACSSDAPPNTYPFTYICAGLINDFASAVRAVDYDAYSGSACQGTGVAGMVNHSVGHTYIHALLPIPSAGKDIVFEQSHYGLIGTRNRYGDTACLRVDRDNYWDNSEYADIAGTYNANPSGCKLYYLNEHNVTNDSGAKRSIILPIVDAAGTNVRLRNEENLNQIYDEILSYGTTATGTKPDGTKMFEENTTISSRHIRRYMMDGDNISAPYCVPRDGFFKNVMYQFYCSWGRLEDVWYYGEGSSYDSHPAIWYPNGTTFTKDIKVVACCDMFGVDDEESPYYHLKDAPPLATDNDPREQRRNANLEAAMDLWIRGEQRVVYDLEGKEWGIEPLEAPRADSEGLAGKIYHHFCRVSEDV